MTQQTLAWSVVMERLEKLERQNRSLKRVGAVALIVVASILLMGQTGSKKIVEANEFILRDTGGKVRGRFSVVSDEASLILSDASEKDRLVATVTKDGPDLAMFDTEGTARVRLDAENYTKKTFTLDGSGKDVILDVGGDGALKLFDAAGKERVELAVARGGGALLNISQDSSRSTLSGGGLGLFDFGTKKSASLLDFSELRFLDMNSGLRKLSVDSDEANIDIFDKQGFHTTIGTADLVTTRTGETHKTSAASVVLFDKDKKVLWQAP